MKTKKGVVRTYRVNDVKVKVVERTRYMDAWEKPNKNRAQKNPSEKPK